MSDDELQRLARAAATGSVDDRARWLTARMRAGLALERVQVAAHAGDAGARVGLGLAEPPETTLDGWCLAFEPFGPEVATRAALVAARSALPVFVRHAPGADAPHAALEAASASLDAPLDDALKTRATEAAFFASDLGQVASLRPARGALPWGPLGPPEAFNGMRAEFLREVAWPNESLVRDLEPFCAGVRRYDDLAGFVIEEGSVSRRVVVVHLTWRRAPERGRFPAKGEMTLSTWIERFLADFDDPVVRGAIAAATASALVVVPGHAQHAPDRLAACVRCAVAATGDETGVRAAVRDAVVLWALGAIAPRAPV